MKQAAERDRVDQRLHTDRRSKRRDADTHRVNESYANVVTLKTQQGHEASPRRRTMLVVNCCERLTRFGNGPRDRVRRIACSKSQREFRGTNPFGSPIRTHFEDIHGPRSVADERNGNGRRPFAERESRNQRASS